MGLNWTKVVEYVPAKGIFVHTAQLPTGINMTAFWKFWESNKEKLKDTPFSLGRSRGKYGKWEFKHWIDTDPETTIADINRRLRAEKRIFNQFMIDFGVFLNKYDEEKSE